MDSMRLLALLGLGLLSVAQQAPPDCKPVIHWGVSGCALSADGTCAKGFHKQLACPANPMIKAPCYWLCVPDAPKKDGAKKEVPLDGHS